MKTPQVSFRHFGGSGPLSIYWYDSPLGDASEADQGNGVGWLSPNGELLAVEFDDVAAAEDHQTLRFGTTVVTVSVRLGKVSVQRSPKRRAA